MVERKTEIGFIAALRATACLLVVYCHLIGNMAKPDWFIRPYIDQFVRDPMGIIWNFGYLGVAIFFIISGFIITHVAQRETRSEFAIKRLFRVYPPFLIALVLARLLAGMENGSPASVSPASLLGEATLFWSQFKVLGPSYTLVMELMFYVVVTALLPLFQGKPILATMTVGGLPVFVRLTLTNAVVGSGSPELARLLWYHNSLSVFAIGMAIYYALGSLPNFPSRTAIAPNC